MLKKAMIYLGLGPDEHYDSYPATGSHRQNDNAVLDDDGQQISAVSGGAVANNAVLGRTVRPIAVVPGHEYPYQQEDIDSTDKVGGRGSESAIGRSSRMAVRSTSGNPYVVKPTDFRDAEEIGGHFKSGQAVLVNLEAVDRDLRRRLVDFSSGLCYGSGRDMKRVGDQMYLLGPAEVDS